jgi:adenylate cyclase
MLGTLLGSRLIFVENRMSFAFFDFLQRATVLEKQSEVAFVVVDQNSIDRFLEDKELMIAWPFPRQIYGAVAKVAAHASAKMLVYDIIFSEPSASGQQDDVWFAQMLKDSGIPAIFPDENKQGSTKKPIKLISSVAAGLGSVNSKNDFDGIFRKYLDGDSFANVIFRKLRPDDSLEAPRYLRNYSETSFPHVSIYDVVKAFNEIEEKKPLTVDLSAFRNKVWLIGYTAPGLYDLKPIPVDREAPGMVVPATAVANILQGEGLRDANHGLNIFLCFLFSLTSVIMIRVQRVRSWAIAGLLTVTLGLCSLLSYLFWENNLWLSPVPLAVSCLVSGGSEFFLVFRAVWRDQLRLAGMLKHSMSPEMVDLVRKGEVEISRFGETRVVSVLFSDLVGFTELSERLSPDELVNVLNGYFDEVVNLVTTGSGYVDKFIGDAVMAVWGAPLQQSNHAHLALTTAISFQKAAERYNEKLERTRPGLKPLGTRVGLHTGPAVVGNIGARHRHNYTAIGDTVNLSARLEGLCKAYGVILIVSEDCVLAAGAFDMPGILEIDKVIVKGKSAATRIFTYVAPSLRLQLKNYSQGRDCYYRGDWQGALKCFEGLDFPPAEVLSKRCRKALDQGGLDEWNNGAWAFDTK